MLIELPVEKGAHTELREVVNGGDSDLGGNLDCVGNRHIPFRARLLL